MKDLNPAVKESLTAQDHIRDATKMVAGHIADAGKMVCNWRQPTYSDAECNAWQSDCDQYWAITEGTPTENGMKFCHGCGKPIKEYPFVDLEDV